MPFNIVPSLASSTRSSANLAVWILCPSFLKSPNPLKAPLVRFLLHKLNSIGGKLHPCLIALPIFTLLFSHCSSHILTFWSMYNLLISFITCKSKPVSCRIFINLVPFTRSNSFCQSMKQAHGSVFMSKVCSGIILKISIASLVLIPY